MVGDAEGDSLELMPRPAELSDGLPGAQKSLGRAASQRDDDAWLHDIDLSFEDGEEGCHFLGGWFPVVGRLVFCGRAKFANVGKVDLITGKPHGF